MILYCIMLFILYDTVLYYLYYIIYYIIFLHCSVTTLFSDTYLKTGHGEIHNGLTFSRSPPDYQQEELFW